MKAKTKRELQCMNYGFKKAVEQRDKEILEIIEKRMKNYWADETEYVELRKLKQQLTTKEDGKDE